MHWKLRRNKALCRICRVLLCVLNDPPKIVHRSTMTDNYNNDIFVYPGERTDEIIVELNDKLGTELNRYSVLYDTNEVNKQMGELQKDYRTRAKINDIFENKN